MGAGRPRRWVGVQGSLSVLCAFPGVPHCALRFTTGLEKNTDLRETVGFLELGNGVGTDVVAHLFFCFYSSLHQPLGKKVRNREPTGMKHTVVKASSETAQVLRPNHRT